MKERKLCPNCKQRPIAINYIRNGEYHYRKFCDVCGRLRKKLAPKRSAWVLSGYKKKPHCEKCGFRAQFPEQLGVYYLDGNLKNNQWHNLKTLCLNCQVEVAKLRLPWRQDPLEPDF